MVLEGRLTKLEKESEEQKEPQCVEMKSADRAESNNQGFQWVDVVSGKKKHNMISNNALESEQAQQIPDLQAKIMTNLVADNNDRERRSKNLIILGIDVSKKTYLDEQRKNDEKLIGDLLTELQIY